MTPESKSPLYDRIGITYARTRQTDPRIAAVIARALGDARTLVNVGAGAGAYEPRDRGVLAVEPSGAMIAQRRTGTAPCVQAVAENLPLRDGAVDASLAVLTLHHWRDQPRGLAELLRVSRRRVVVLTWDPDTANAFWLTTEYFPEFLDLDAASFPGMDGLRRMLGAIRVTPVPIPYDCQDGFLGAFWQRPEAYLDPAVRDGISSFAQIGPDQVQRGIARLAHDLGSGRWEAQYGSLRELGSLDLGYRLVVAERG